MNCLGKIRYKTRASADRRAAWDLKRHGVHQRSYPCSKCKGYHLSRMPFAEFLDRATDQTLAETAEALRQEYIRDEVLYLQRRVDELAQIIAEDRKRTA